MPNVRGLSRSFAGGEIAPELFSRMDLANFQTGLALCRNFITLPHGPATNRGGSEFVRQVKFSNLPTRLIPFSFNTEQTFSIEVGHEYVRFHTQGATLIDGGVPYEVATPYDFTIVFALHFVQSADVLTIVHPGYAPRELRRLGPTSWTLTEISFAPAIDAPTGATGSALGPGGGTPVDELYVVTAVAADGILQSLASNVVTLNIDLTVIGNHNEITWDAVPAAVRYNIYKQYRGLYGYIGQTVDLVFTDDNIDADVTRTPPNYQNPFVGAGNYPAAVNYDQQRRAFAGTYNRPQNVWLTRSGTESDMSSSIPSQDDDAIAFRVAGSQVNVIRHLAPLADMLLLTSSTEWRMTTANTDTLTPKSVSVKAQSYAGSSNVQPVLANNRLVFSEARGGHLQELVYTNDAGGYVPSDLSILAPHLFDFYSPVDMAFTRSPVPVVWTVRSDGVLLGMTYVPDQKVIGWHQHVTKGAYEAVTAIVEGRNEVLYTIVRRTINGATVRYVERMASAKWQVLADAYFVDAGLTYRGAPATIISGLGHLEGETVAILGDGAVFPQQVVTAGQITLEQPASVVHVGLPYNCDLQTLPFVIEQAQAFGTGGRPKNINKAWLRVNRSSSVFAGPSFDKLKQFKQRTNEPYGSPPRVIENAEIEISVDPDWSNDGHLCVRQSDPLPLTVSAITLEASVGG